GCAAIAPSTTRRCWLPAYAGYPPRPRWSGRWCPSPRPWRNPGARCAPRSADGDSDSSAIPRSCSPASWSPMLCYTEGPISVRLMRDRTLLCEVYDGSETVPRLRAAADDDDGGRGLHLVKELSSRWGTR